MTHLRNNQNEEFNNSSEEQNVQRLGFQESSNPIPPVLGDLINHDRKILQKREELIKNKQTRGNNRHINAYKKMLPTELDQLQFSWSLGLVLGDATLQANTSSSNLQVRLKIQQAVFNNSLLKATEEILKPWVTSISGPSERNMMELSTLQGSAFVPLANLVQDPNVELQPGACVRKRIPENIADFLDPIAIAAWFCCDGGRRDYGLNEGKAIQFHTQGFSQQCIDRLVHALRSRYGWNVRSKYDGKNRQGGESYLIQIEADSFEAVVDVLLPYILPYFIKRLPKPRSNQSRWKPTS